MTDRYATLRQGLVGAWCPSLGASGYTVIDRTNYAHHAAFSGTSIKWTASREGVAVDLPGGQYLSAGLMDGLAFSTPFAASAWIYNVTPNSADTAVVSKLLNQPGKATPNTADYTGWMMYLSGGKVILYHNTAVRVTGATTVTGVTRWRHLVVQWTGTAAQVWLNGVLDGSGSTTTAPAAAACKLEIGRYDAGTTDRTAKGLIDDVRVWTRSLAPSEINILASRRGIGLAPTRHRRAKRLGAQVWLRDAGAWKAATPWIKVNGVWKQATPNLNVSGTWK